MDVSVRHLRNQTAQVLAAVQSGTRVVLTVHGRPVADIVPHEQRAERRPTDRLLAELDELSQLSAALGVASEAKDFDTGLTTDDLLG